VILSELLVSAFLPIWDQGLSFGRTLLIELAVGGWQDEYGRDGSEVFAARVVHNMRILYYSMNKNGVKM